MDAAWEFGLTHFDTADAYGGGRSETAIGRWIASRGVRPQLTTKTYNPMRAGADHGLSPERIARQLRDEPGPARGRPRRAVPGARVRPATCRCPRPSARSSRPGPRAVGAYGVSNFTAAQLARLAGGGRAAAPIQNSYSLLDAPGRAGASSRCAPSDGVSYLAFSPLAGGWLTGKYRRGEPFPAGSRMTQRPEPYRGFVSGPIFDALDRLAAIAADRGMSMGGLALAWLLADERVAQIVVGPGRPEHLAAVGEALRIR